ncbi:hypothetical protein ACFWP3_22760 [Streptomyces sp. NPDC058525]|uniref:hypothetical protein n=1 Tax=Streptomyces sp. NPDC058525 TaxID=3346538 RepID=UPI003659EB3E
MLESPVALRHGRDLVSPELFEKVSDPGWHSFVLHTQAYAAWCDEQFGFFLGHEPKATVRTRPLIGSVVDRVRAAGFYVDDRLWGAAKDCNPPACCGDGDGC